MDNLNHYIDHTNLKADATVDDINKLCLEAREFNFYSVCVNPSYVSIASKFLENTNIKVCTVVGFPLGATINEVKAEEAKLSIYNGAEEIDMVINVGFLKSGKIKLVEKDILSIREVCNNVLLKVIIETCLLTDDEKILACKISKECGADFVKTSTGMGVYGATENDVTLMKKTVGSNVGVKASGGIRTLNDTLKMIEAGANRIGASNSVNIIKSYLCKE